MKKKSWKKAHLDRVRKLAKNPEWLSKMKKINEHRQIAVHTNENEYFISLSEASRLTGAHKANIRACINGKIKTCVGRKWFYTNG